MAKAATAAPPTTTTVSPTTAYARAVVDGEIVAGRPVRLACRRHLDDLEHGHERGLRFDVAAEKRVLDFFGFLRLSEGEFAGKPFALQPFQQFIVGSLFGWIGDDGYRRFRKAYIEIGKGNGKSPLAAGIGIYGMVADGEQGAEIYSAATTREQAGILWMDAKHMVEASPALSKAVAVNVRNLAVLATNSYFRPVSSEANTLDGKRVQMALIDELHEHPSPDVLDKMQAGTKGRRQPLIFEITNSGWDRNSVCWTHHTYSLQVLDGVLEDDGWFAYVCALDEGDEWTDESVWTKVNPNLGVSVTWKYLREQVKEAVGMPSKQNIVQRLNFCIWTSQDVRFLDMARWDACNLGPIDADALKGRTCYAGLDLASTTDIAALVLVFPRDNEQDTDESDAEADESEPIPDEIPPPTDGIQPVEPAYRAPLATVYDVLPFFWVPKENLQGRVRRDKVPYDVWERQGFLTATEGNVIDYETIRLRIVGQHEEEKPEIQGLADDYRLVDLGFDRWGATQITQQLTDEGITVVPVGQGYRSLSPPTKELLRLVVSRRINHGGNPVLRWMAGNVRVTTDPAENVKPDKAKSTQRIDGVVALVMSLDRAIRNANTRSVYESERGLLVL